MTTGKVSADTTDLELVAIALDRAGKHVWAHDLRELRRLRDDLVEAREAALNAELAEVLERDAHGE